MTQFAAAQSLSLHAGMVKKDGRKREGRVRPDITTDQTRMAITTVQIRAKITTIRIRADITTVRIHNHHPDTFGDRETKRGREREREGWVGGRDRQWGERDGKGGGGEREGEERGE